MKKIVLLCLIAATVLAAETNKTQTVKTEKKNDISVKEIVDKANVASYYNGKNGRAKTHMVITDKQGRKRDRQFTILRYDKKDGGDQKFYVYFEKPADVRRMVFMVWKHPEKDDDRWLYLPSLDLVKRISAGDKRTSFAGSDFFYEDVSGRSPLEDEHKLIETTKNFYVLDNVPKDPGSVEFSHYKMWIHKKTFLPLKMIFYDRNGAEYRIIEALKIIRKKNIQIALLTIPSDYAVSIADILVEAGIKGILNFTGVHLNLPKNIYVKEFDIISFIEEIGYFINK